MSRSSSSSFPRSTARAVTHRPARYYIMWQNPISNEQIGVRITHTRDYLRVGQDHVEVESTRPKRAALPITESGYRSHFLDALELINAGGPVSFVEAWLARESSAEPWRKRELARCQGDLFRWADNTVEATRRRPASGSSPRQQRIPDPDHIADLEQNDGQRLKRMAQRDRGRKPKPPRGP